MTASSRASSPTQSAVPTDRRMASAAPRCSPVTASFANSAVTPQPRSAGVFGMVRTTGAG